MLSVNATFSAQSILLLNGTTQTERLESLPSAKELLDLSAYPASMVSEMMCDSRITATLTMTAQDKESGELILFDSAEKTLALPSGVLPDINLANYALVIKSEDFGVAPSETRQRMRNGEPLKYETIEISLTVKSRP